MFPNQSGRYIFCLVALVGCILGRTVKLSQSLDGFGSDRPAVRFGVGNISHTSFVNVKDFGAKGNGKTDDTKAFKAALAAMKNNNGGIVYAPTGNEMSYF